MITPEKKLSKATLLFRNHEDVNKKNIRIGENRKL